MEIVIIPEILANYSVWFWHHLTEN